MHVTKKQGSHQPPGFTIIELIVALGVIGLLAALLIPAVQQARESSRKITCQNNLRQVGVAIGTVAEAAGAFPTSEKPSPAYWRLLPYLDSGAVSTPLLNGKSPESFSVPVLACPNDGVASVNMVYGETNYYYNDGTSFRRYAPTNGFRKSPLKDTRPAEVTDGFSQTAMMSERLVRPLVASLPTTAEMEAEPKRYFWWTQTRFGGKGEEPQAIIECGNHRTTVDPQFFGSNLSNYRGDHGYDHMLPPNHPACYNGPEDFDVDTDLVLIPASSLHIGGVNTMMGDGSVHFVNDKIESAVWQALGTRNGHEEIASPFGE